MACGSVAEWPAGPPRGPCGAWAERRALWRTVTLLLRGPLARAAAAMTERGLRAQIFRFYLPASA